MPKWTAPPFITVPEAQSIPASAVDWTKSYPDASMAAMTLATKTHEVPRLLQIEKTGYGGQPLTRFNFAYKGTKVQLSFSDNVIYEILHQENTPIEEGIKNLSHKVANFLLANHQLHYAVGDQVAIGVYEWLLEQYEEDKKKSDLALDYANQTLGLLDPGALQSQQHSIAETSKQLPGMDYVVSQVLQTEAGCWCGGDDPILWNFVQHLNDFHRFSREKIADWLDELHDSGKINLEFQPWEEPTNESTD